MPAELHPVLAGHLRAWQRQTPHADETDFVFPSMRTSGRKPLCSSVFVADHLRPAAKKAGVHIEDGQRFGFHNLRHSLRNWRVNKTKVEPKTVRGILRHAKIQTTLDQYTQKDSIVSGEWFPVCRQAGPYSRGYSPVNQNIGNANPPRKYCKSKIGTY
jgi:integrase